LIKNGIDAMKGKGTLSVQLTERSKQIEILVSDTGSGMKKEIASKILNPGLPQKVEAGVLAYHLPKELWRTFIRVK
jgi:two-component system, sporulation sensor kinase D